MINANHSRREPNSARERERNGLRRRGTLMRPKHPQSGNRAIMAHGSRETWLVWKLAILLAFVIAHGTPAHAQTSTFVSCGTELRVFAPGSGASIHLFRTDDAGGPWLNVRVSEAAPTPPTVARCPMATIETVTVTSHQPGEPEAKDQQLILDLSGGPFAPGATPESTGASEIEFSIDLGGDDCGAGFCAEDNLVIIGTSGPDRINLGTEGINWNGDEDVDVVLSRPLPAGAYTGDGDDLITGDGGAGTGSTYRVGVSIYGGGGDDRMVGGRSADGLAGGPGDDRIYGGPHDAGFGDDRIYGQDGNDILSGQGARDRVSGGNGDDVITGGTGEDSLTGGDGNDVIYARDGETDRIWGQTGFDRAHIDPGRDRVSTVERFF